MAVTPNLGLYKPTRDDYINVERDISQNMEKIDEAVGMAVDAPELGIVIDGNTANVDVAKGQTVVVRNSTISNIDDGIYMAKDNKAAGETFSESTLSAFANGVLNSQFIKWHFYDASNAYGTPNIQADDVLVLIGMMRPGNEYGQQMVFYGGNLSGALGVGCYVSNGMIRFRFTDTWGYSEGIVALKSENPNIPIHVHTW